MECQQGFEPIYIANIYHLYTTYILPIGWLFATYHLFPGTRFHSIEVTDVLKPQVKSKRLRWQVNAAGTLGAKTLSNGHEGLAGRPPVEPSWGLSHSASSSFPRIPTTIKTMGVNITTIAYLRLLSIEIESTIIFMVVEAQGFEYLFNL